MKRRLFTMLITLTCAVLPARSQRFTVTPKGSGGIEINIPAMNAQQIHAKNRPSAPEAVDLGLSVKWASCNVGAERPEEYGSYFAWGETEERDNYDWENYLYYDADAKDNIYIGTDICGTKYDVAHVTWGKGWRMPTEEECKELLEKCTSEWVVFNNVHGRRFTGPNGNSIFLPMAGHRWGKEVKMAGKTGDYWSGTPFMGKERSAYFISMVFEYASWLTYREREYGRCVRPVTK